MRQGLQHCNFPLRLLCVPTGVSPKRSIEPYARLVEEHQAVMTWFICVVDHADTFMYTNQGEAPEIDGVSDVEDLQVTRDAFSLLGTSLVDRSSGLWSYPLRGPSETQFTQGAEADLHANLCANPWKLCATYVNTPIDSNVFHYLHGARYSC